MQAIANNLATTYTRTPYARYAYILINILDASRSMNTGDARYDDFVLTPRSWGVDASHNASKQYPVWTANRIMQYNGNK